MYPYGTRVPPPPPRRDLGLVTGVPPGKDMRPVEVLWDGDGVPRVQGVKEIVCCKQRLIVSEIGNIASSIPRKQVEYTCFSLPKYRVLRFNSLRR